RDSPIKASRRASSRTLRPASIRIRALDVARNAVLPELPLARTQNRTVTNLPRSVLAVWAVGKHLENIGGGERRPPISPRTLFRHFLFDHVHQFLNGGGALLQCCRLFRAQF